MTTEYEERKTAKGVILDDQGRVMLLSSFLIGGGVEAGESYEEALHREAMEEAGAKVEIVKSLGEVINYHDLLKRKYITHGFLCKFIEIVSAPTTNEADERGQVVVWETLNEAIDRIRRELDELKASNNQPTDAAYVSGLLNRDMTLKFLKKAYYMNMIESAIQFAERKFAEAGTGNHFLEVYQILKDKFNVEDEEILIAGLLHDTLEDTETTYEEIEQNFSKRVADLVQEVSHPKNYNAEQKVEYYEKIKHISPEAKMIKLADFASHLPKFIGALKGEIDYPKFTHNQYCVLIRSFLESCDESPAKEYVAKLNDELDSRIPK